MTVDGLYEAAADAAIQRRAFRSGELPVAVYGLGKMGLPLAAVYAETCGSVIGVDVDPTVVDTIAAGKCHVRGEPGLSSLVAEQVESGRLCATIDGTVAAKEAAIHVVIVPTLLTDDDEPDLSRIDAVLSDVASGLSPGDLVILESTVPPGTTREAVCPTLVERSGLDPGTFGVAFCPERTASGTALRDIRGQYPKVVGGVDDESARAAALCYDVLTDAPVHVVSDATTAEAVKVFGGVYRDVNIALANELATLACDLDISVREAIETANHVPTFDIHDPGPGVGGHCIPYYPYFLREAADRELQLSPTARRINDGMPAETVAMLESALESDGQPLETASVVVLGITYRAGVAETRAAPAVEIIDQLSRRGVSVAATDPLVDPEAFGATPLGIEELYGESFDAAVLVTAHEEFRRIDWDRVEPLVVVDGRDALDLDDTRHTVYTLGGTSDTGPVVYAEEPSGVAIPGRSELSGSE